MPGLAVALVLSVAAALGAGAAYAANTDLGADVRSRVAATVEHLPQVAVIHRNSAGGTGSAIATVSTHSGRASAESHASAEVSASTGRLNALARLSENLARQQAHLAAVGEQAAPQAREALAGAARHAEHGLATAIAGVEASLQSTERTPQAGVNGGATARRAKDGHAAPDMSGQASLRAKLRLLLGGGP